jgi:N12 class adenine-specific DNA methylase
MARAPSLSEALAQAAAPSLDDVLATDQPSYDFGGFAGGNRVGERALANKLAESKTPEFKRETKARDAATARKAKPIEADSEIERMGETFWQRVRGLGGGGGRLALTGLEEIGIDPNGDAAQWLRGKTQSAEEYAARPIEGAAKAPTIDDIRKGNVGIGNLARFVLEQGASSVADMGVLASGVGILPYVGLQTGSTAQQRAENNNQSDATADDVFKALPSAVASAALEKIGMHGIFGAGAKSVVGRIAQAFGTEALTEAIQSPIEYAGSNLGTDAGFDPMEAANQAVAGAIAGGAMGGGIRGAIETPGAIARRVRGAPVAPGVIEAAETAAPVITPEDEASPIPTELIAEGKRVAGTATASTDANRILSDNGAPAVGSKVTVNVGGKPRTGTVRDAFVDESDADLGAQPGLSIDLDGGGTMREFFADLNDAGVSIEAAGIDPAAMDRAIADMEAGGLSPASTLDAIAETGETPAVPSLDELTPAPAPAAPRVPSGGAFDTNAYMARARRAESGGDDGAANTRSSASGRYQFTDSTFARYYAKVYGGNPPAGSKNDPVIQDRLMKAMTDENIAGLKTSGIAVNDSAVYAAHHFGLGGAREMYRDPSSPVDAAIVKANPQFKGMTNAQALAWVGNHIGAQPGAPTAPSSRPTPIEEVDRERLVDEPLTTQQVEATARAPDAAPAPETAAEPSEAASEVAAPAAAAPEAPAYTITDTPSGKGIAVANITEAQQAVIAAAVPKARAVANKDGAFVYSAKYRDAIETALSSSTPATTPAAELTPEQQRASIKTSDTLAGGMPVAEAAAAARAVQDRAKPRARSGPVDAVTFLADLGGIQDTEGHALKQRARGQGAGSRDISQFAPGGGHVFRKDGMTIDEAGEALQEAGYFTERPTTTQVLEMLDRSAFENQYRPADIPDVEQRRAERRDEQDREGARVAASAALDEIGLTDANEADIEGIAAFMSDGRSSGEAVESYYRQQAEARSADYYEQTNDDEFDIPFDGPATRSADFGNVEGFERSAPVARAAAGSAAPGRNAVEDRGAQADAFGERDGDQRRALERAAEGRSRATAAQKPAGSDGGLFDNNASQADLLDARAVASGPTVQPTSFAEAVAKNPERAIFDLSDDQVESVGRRLNQKRKKGESKVAFVERIVSANPGANVRKAAIDTVAYDADVRAEQLRKQGAKPAPVPAPSNVAPGGTTVERARELAGIIKSGRDGDAITVDDSGKLRGFDGRVILTNVGNVSPDGVASAVAAEGQRFRKILRETEDAPAPVPTPAPAPASAKPTVSANKIFTDDAAERARAVLREALKGTQLNSGIDPVVVQAGITLAGYYIEKGSRTFSAYSRAMVEDMGEVVRPYLRGWYEAIRYHPAMTEIAAEMSTPAQIEEEGNGDQGAVSTGDAGASAQDVQRDAEDGGARRAPDGEGEGSRSDVPADQRGRADASERTAEGRPAPTGDRGTGARDADRVPARESDAGRGRGERAAASDAKRVTGENWSIAPGSLDETRGAAAKARDNVRAIEIVRELDSSGMPATREQQEALAKYVGWGGLKNAFNETNGSFAKGFEEVGPRVRELLTDEEYDTARRSIQYAHYTSEKIIRPMWQAAQAMGFTGGMVFEPGMGTGNFLGMMPAELAARTRYQGLEFDGITARIAQLLYPQSGINQKDFTRGTLPKDAFDLVIGNPPFSGTVVKSDPEYGKLGFVLHDFFFAKSLDAVRPGGLLMFVTSAGTMNKVGTEARAWMADRADLVGAVRLPGGAFRENAGTDVTTDIVVLRKRAPGDAPGSRAWVDTTELTLPTRSGGTGPVEVSNYFVENPDQILGEQGLFDQLAAGERYGVRVREGSDMAADLTRALDTIASGARIEQRDAVAETAAAEFDMDSTERKEGSFYVGKDGRLMQHRNGLGSPVQGRGKGVTGGISAEAQERIKALVPIRDALRTVLGHDMAGRSEQATAARETLNSAYDRFVQQFGPINKAEIRYQRPSVIEQESARAAAREETRLMGGFFNEGDFVADDPNAKLAELARARTAAREAAAAMGREFDEGDFDPAELPDKVIVKRPNVDAFMDDQEGYRLRSIEHYNDDTGEAQKGPVFYKNVVSQDRAPEIRSSGDALLYVLNRTGRPDIDEIAMRAGISRDQVLEELADKVFKIPGQGDTYQTREQYLSGNVRAKLVTAQAAAARDADFRHNVAALEAVQPRPLGPTDISASLGMPWIPEGVIAEFAKTLGLNNVAIRYRPKLAQWSAHGNAYGAAATSEWGTSRRDAIALLGDALNRQTPIIYDNFRDAEGKEQRVRNDTETVAAQDKMRAILARFKDWVWEDAKRATDLVSLYNTEYNNLVAPVYDGGYLTTPGIAEGWSWRPHQQRVVSRIIQSGNTYMAHAVGAGKTSAMIGAGMEMRRLGLVRKPMYVVPNHMLGQFTKEFYEQYPTAKIMVADEKQFHTDRRKQFVANVGTSDLDAVIITHSAFGFIPISEDFNEKLLKTQISEFRAILNELKSERSSGDQSQRITQRNIEQQIESMEQKIRGRKKRSDQVFTFEETGIDFLFVDEAHLFRKLDFATKMSNVRGVDPNGSGMSYDLFAKTRYLEEQAPGRSHVLASGTPVTNTMAELFSVQRYLQPQELAARALGQFDAWAGAFGETVTQLEQDPAGGYKPVTRFAKFVNVPELSAMVRQVMDVVTSRELEQYVVRPKLLGGSRKMIVSAPTPALDAFQASLAARMQAIEQRKGKPKKGDDILLSVIGDGRKAAIDMRLVNPAIREEGKSKLETLIDNVSRIAKETENHPFYKAEATGYAAEPFMRGRATQMVFSDLGINGDFQVHRYMRQQFIARGLKDSEVAIISDYKTSVARQRLFNDMNEGKVRVLIGSVPKMGTGVNAQKRLYAIHNLDPQWYPANDEQRNGRGLRQGNMNRELGIFDYSTKATYDSTMWGLMETKARFIEGFFNGDPTMRSMEDLGEASQYEQAKALTTTDPRILELTQDKQDLERAMLRRAAFDRDLYAVRERITSAEARIDRLTAALPLREADLAQRQDLTGENFAAKVGGKTFTDRTEFGEAMLDRLNELAAGGLSLRDRAVGEISGFKLTADVAMYGKGEAQVALYLNRNGDVQERVKAESALGISSSAGAIMRGFEGDIQEAQDGIERAKREIAEYTPQTTKTFTGEAEIAELEGRVAEMEDTLTKEAATRASVRAAPAPAALPDGAKLSIDDDAIGADADAYMESDYEALRVKLAAQAKRMGVGGDRLVTSVVSKIMNDDRIAGMYFNGVITVATDVRASPERTFNHEFIHALKDMGLFRDAEWTVLSREARTDPKLMKKIAGRYPNLDEEGQIEEAVAEMFADWKGERTGFRGAALGRIRDFIDAIRRLIRGVDTSGDIMRRINAGTVGAREGAAQGGDVRQSIFGQSAANPNPQTVSEATERAKTFVGNMAERYDSFRIAMQDRMLPVLRAQTAVERVIGRELTDAEQPYLAEELMTGRVGAKLGHLTEDHIEPLMNALEAEKISVEEIESFLYAKHAPERNAYIASVNTDFAQGEGSGMTDIEAAAILARIDATGKTRQFERVADRVYALLQFSRDERADAGLLSAEQLDSWNSAYKFYVPLRGFAELDNGDARPNTGGQGITVRGAESKKAFGRRSKADDILAHSIMQAEEAITRGEKNRVARAFYDLAKASPDDDFWKINKVTMERRMNPLTGLVESYPVRALLARDADMTVSLKIDGKEARVTMNEKNPQARKLAASMRHLDEQKTSGALVYLSKWNRFLSTANTSLSADFIVTNAFRDMQTAAVNLAGIDLPGLQKRVAKDYRKAFVASMKGSFDKGSGPWADAWTEYADAGGRIYYNQMQDVAGITRDFEKRFDPKRKLTGANTAPKQLAMIAYGDMKAAFEFIEKVNNGVENSVRLATFKNARELGASPDQAASIARNLTVNFTRKGEKAVLVNSMYLFYNASIQGSARLLMALKHPKVQKIVAGIVVAGALQELLSMFISPDDDDGEKVYDKIPEFQKSRNMIVMVKGPWGDYLAIPMPYGYSAFHTLGRNMVRAMRPGEKPLDAGIDTLKAFVDGFNPVGSGSLLNMVAPTFVDPLVDLTQNRDFADRPIMPDQNQFGPETPDNQRYWNSVNPVWKGVTDTLNTATGGDKVIPGAIDVSPETLEYLFGVVTGAAGAQVSRAVGGAAKMVDGDADTALGLGDLPVVRKIAGKKPEWYDKAAFYARVGEVEQKIDNTKKYAQSGDTKAVEAYVAKELPSLGLMELSSEAKKAMSDIRQAKGALDQAKEKKTIDAATYTQQKKELTESEKTVILVFNKAYLKAIDEPLRP